MFLLLDCCVASLSLAGVATLLADVLHLVGAPVGLDIALIEVGALAGAPARRNSHHFVLELKNLDGLQSPPDPSLLGYPKSQMTTSSLGLEPSSQTNSLSLLLKVGEG